MVDIGAPVENRGEGPKGKMERRQQSSENRNLEETRITSGGAECKDNGGEVGRPG